MSGVGVWAFGEVRVEVGLGVVVGGEESARGMEEVTRSKARGRCLRS